jgi:hypothetical protein
MSFIYMSIITFCSITASEFCMYALIFVQFYFYSICNNIISQSLKFKNCSIELQKYRNCTVCDVFVAVVNQNMYCCTFNKS